MWNKQISTNKAPLHFDQTFILEQAFIFRQEAL